MGREPNAKELEELKELREKQEKLKLTIESSVAASETPEERPD